MREEDKIVHYRPELVDLLNKIMEGALQMYEQNQTAMLYIMLESDYAKKKDEASEKLLHDAAICLIKNKAFCYEIFDEKYRSALNKLSFGLGDITNASAARTTFEVYKTLIEKDKASIDMSDFTKSEKYMVDHFFNILLAPTRNPNIQIHEGHSKCYYDEHRDASFSKDMKDSIEFIKNNCNITLEIFNTPDKEDELDEVDF